MTQRIESQVSTTPAFASDGLGTLGVLPPELRRLIASVVFSTSDPIFATSKGISGHPLTLLSHQIRNETMDLYWRCSTFHVDPHSRFLCTDQLPFPHKFLNIAKHGLQLQLAQFPEVMCVWIDLAKKLAAPHESAKIFSVEVLISYDDRPVGLPMTIFHSRTPEIRFAGSEKLCKRLDLLVELCRSVFADGFVALRRFKSRKDPPELKKLKLELASFFEHSRLGKVTYSPASTFILFNMPVKHWVWADLEKGGELFGTAVEMQD